MRTLISVLLTAVVLLTLAPGRADPQVVLHELASPNPQSTGCFGNAVAFVGDVNNDGYNDVIVGASIRWMDPPVGEGRAYVFSGATGDTLYTLVSPQGTAGYFGNAVSGVGDVDGDGCDDVVVGAYYEDAGAVDAGAAYVFSGQTGSLLHTLVSPNAAAPGCFGSGVAGTGDVDADGCPDVVVGAPCEDYQADQDGRAYVFSGATGALLRTLVSPNPDPQYQDWFGLSVSGIGDLNGDGYADVVVASDEEIASVVGVGKVYVFSGATGDTLYTLVSSNQEYAGHFGWSVWGHGDVDDDGYNDVVVGAWGEDAGTGRAYVFSGQSGALLYQLVSPDQEASGWFGLSVSSKGDTLMVGAPKEDGGPSDAGRAYAFRGQDGSWLCTLESPNAGYDGWFGWCVCGRGNWSNDGWADLVVGAPFEDPGASPEGSGMAYVFTLPPTSAPDDAAGGTYSLALQGPFPNPSDGSVRLTIRALGGGAQRSALSLYDAAGRRVATAHHGSVREGQILSWTVPAGLGPGAYWWRLKAGDQELQRPMVLTR